MKRIIFGLLYVAAFTTMARAQEEARFTVEVSSRSILFGNHFKVTFTLENARGGAFAAPDFSAFYIVSGPNKASSMSIINGQVSQSISYSYYLEPREVGNFYILPASIDLGDRLMETQAVEITVAPNPDGLKQSPEPRQTMPGNRFAPDDFNNRGDEFPGFDRLNELFRQMIPNDDGDGFHRFRDSLPGFDLEEFLRMMPEWRMDIPDQLREAPQEPGRKKKRRIYKV